jgi:hypothetical protein
MEHKQAAWFIIVLFLVLGVIGALSAIAIPHISEMAYASKVEDKTSELLTIQSAVIEMLCQSPAGKLQSVGPTVDMNLVCTVDASPLVLADFLSAGKDERLTSGYVYSFTADGMVLQFGE